VCVCGVLGECVWERGRERESVCVYVCVITHLEIHHTPGLRPLWCVACSHAHCVSSSIRMCMYVYACMCVYVCVCNHVYRVYMCVLYLCCVWDSGRRGCLAKRLSWTVAMTPPCISTSFTRPSYLHDAPYTCIRMCACVYMCIHTCACASDVAHVDCCMRVSFACPRSTLAVPPNAYLAVSPRNFPSASHSIHPCLSISRYAFIDCGSMRSISYYKAEKYSLSCDDAQTLIEMKPKSGKGYLRRAMAHARMASGVRVWWMFRTSSRAYVYVHVNVPS
jgi:hypothetical protein